jgi:hypothetical protein
MLDRQKREAILSRRFPGSPRDQLAAAANAIMGLAEEWEEVRNDERIDPALNPRRQCATLRADCLSGEAPVGESVRPKTAASAAR